MRKGVLESEFTEEIVRISDDRSHSGRDVGEKVTILEDELMGFVKSVNVLRCRGSNSNWRINQTSNTPEQPNRSDVVKSLWLPLQSDFIGATPRSRSLFCFLEARNRSRSDLSQRPIQVAPEARSDLSERRPEVAVLYLSERPRWSDVLKSLALLTKQSSKLKPERPLAATP
uniref:Uncharacterized protein n=1 Tax=Brassica campestris TaxID=3711 RepID=M4F4H3_BRACM